MELHNQISSCRMAAVNGISNEKRNGSSGIRNCARAECFGFRWEIPLEIE